jgi:hypothetical protein
MKFPVQVPIMMIVEPGAALSIFDCKLGSGQFTVIVAACAIGESAKHTSANISGVLPDTNFFR